jgi:(p)ppGpp synthase/HD superfamily hydrolase
LHTTLFGPFGTPLEVQIRTSEMHKIAEAGVASHWLYKTFDTSLSDLQKKTHQWLQSLLQMQSESGDSAEFLEHLKVDLFPDEVYVFTPRGQIMALPRGATAVDFAYAVHTDIGNRCVAVKINQELMPLRTELKNGDRVEIITAAHAKPNPLWLNFVATGKARSRIRHFLKTMHFQESARLGERLLHQALVALGSSPSEINDPQWDKFVRDAGAKSREEVLADVGLGKRLAAVIARKLLSRSEPGPHDAPLTGSVIIRGSEGMAVQFAQCCRPIPGDPIIGVISKGQGMVIHTHDCPVIAKARHHGAHYIYSLVGSGYVAPPKGLTVAAGQYYNKYFPGDLTSAWSGDHKAVPPGGVLAMAPPLAADKVTFDDGTKSTVDQQAKDVAAFLMWAAEPKMRARKSAGLTAVLFLQLLTVLLWFTHKKIWAPHKGKHG